MLEVQRLAQTPLFSGIEREDIEALCALGTVSEYERGVVLFTRSSRADALMLIESGAVELFFPVQVLGAVREIVVERLSTGDALAWSALVSPYRLTLSARCTEASAVRSLPRESVHAYLQEHPHVGYQFMRNLASIVGHRLSDFQTIWMHEIDGRLGGRAER